MDINYRKITQKPSLESKMIVKCDTKNITEQDLKNLIKELIDDLINKGYTEQEIEQYTFYRYVSK